MYHIYTRSGDKGTTALFGGSRTDKDNIRVEAYGTVDELISMLGVCHATTQHHELRGSLHMIQKTLFMLGAELASDDKGLTRLKQTIDDSDIQVLEQLIDRNMAQSGPLKQFVIPGKNLASAQFHMARTLTRRLERILITMDRTLPLRNELKRYINRLSDALFSMARIEETTPEAGA
ncbi:MAG: cob(I)yrinic acid a,c-diamide adenosyltransferase [Enterobacteriaceae bacterium]|nr:cob(I)yrinic acid a,c-diamide adenosyltransferase [Enterobacteriaceae bacterium]